MICIEIDKRLRKIFKTRPFRLKESDSGLVLQAHYCNDLNADPESHWITLDMRDVEIMLKDVDNV